MSAAVGRFGYENQRRKLGTFRRLLADWTRVDLLYGFFLTTILYSVIVEIKYEAAASNLARDAFGDGVIAGASGSVMRQVAYFAVFLAVAALTIIRTRGIPAMPISLPYNLACFWCLISFTWAIAPGISFRRALGMYIILLAVGFCVQALGARKTLQVVYAFLSSIVISSLVAGLLSSIPLFAFAAHPPDEMDRSLVGAWRGVMMHKNVAGAVMIHASIFFLHHAMNRRKLLDFALFAMAVTILLMTKSKTSVGWCVFVFAAGLVYRAAMIRHAHALFALGTGLFVFALAVVGFSVGDEVYAFLTNPLSLSGRVEIWQSLLPYISDHPFFGSGYGSFWAIGTNSPIFRLALSDFISKIGHSHSGYIEILLTTGVFGLALALVALLIVPFYRFAHPLKGDARLNPMLFSIWLFGMLQNMSESQFFSPDKQSWIFVVIAITIVHTRWRAACLGRTAWLQNTAWFPYTSARGETRLEYYR